MESLINEINNEHEREYIKAHLHDFFRREERTIPLEEKVNFTAFVINHSNILIELDDFYEEECQLAIINWVLDNKKQLELEESHLITALLYNLLIILEIFPIKTTDFISLKIIEKLNSIKRSVRNTHFEFAVRIQSLISFWKESINEMMQLVNKEQFLNKKTTRNSNNNETIDINVNKKSSDRTEGKKGLKLRRESESDFLDSSTIDISPNNDRKLKTVKWKEDIVEEIIYCIDEPFLKLM